MVKVGVNLNTLDSAPAMVASHIIKEKGITMRGRPNPIPCSQNGGERDDKQRIIIDPGPPITHAVTREV